MTSQDNLAKMSEDLINIQDKLTQTGPIREGLNYQDAYAAYLFVDWLKHPERYKWAKLEADEFGSLDDIVICDKENRINLNQIKFSCHPDAPKDEWTWEHLLKENKGKTRHKLSLFKKWFLSWAQEDKKRVLLGIRPRLITNRKAGRDIIDSTEFCRDSTGRKVNFKKFKTRYGQYFNEAMRQIYPASEKDLQKFFVDFIFLFDEPSLNDIWNYAERNFLEWGGCRSDWMDFREKIRIWATRRDEPSPTGKITIEYLRVAAGWIKLRPLYQEFFMPDDFVLFDDKIDKILISEFKKNSGGLHVLFGSPGVGKSTYLTHLYKKLTELKWPVLKHHYYVSPNDPEFFNRLKYERASEGLKSEIFRLFRRELGDIGNRNPGQANLREYLTCLSKYFCTMKKSLVLIIDGLDHVTTHSDVEQLHNFLDEILPSSEGLWVVLGTRPIPEHFLPPSVYAARPKDRWIEVRPFSFEGVRNIVIANIKNKRLNIPKVKNIVADFIKAFYKLTEGHPLHIRYSIESLTDLSDKQIITASNLQTLPPYGGNIENYYGELWRRLRNEGKNIAILMAAANFALKREHIVESFNVSAKDIQILLESFEQIKHLTKNTARGLVFFHPSFTNYVINTPEFQCSKNVMKTHLKEWLKTIAPETIRWENLLRLEYELDNPEPLLTTLSKEWAIEAITNLHAFSLIEQYFMLGIDAAMQKKNFPLALSIGLLSNRVQNLFNENEDNYENLLSLLLEDKDSQDLDNYIPEEQLPYFSSRRLNTFATIANKKSRTDIVKKILEELNRNYDRDEFRGEYRRRYREHTLAKIVAYLRISPKRVLKWINSFKENDVRVELLRPYCNGLLNTEQYTNIECLLSESLPRWAKSNILEVYSKYCLQKKIDNSVLVLSQRKDIIGNYSWLLLMFVNKLPRKIRFIIPVYDSFPPELEDYLTKESSTLMSKFFKCYTSALLLSFRNQVNLVDRWLNECQSETWSLRAASLLVNLGKEHGKKIKNGEIINYDDLIGQIEGLNVPEWPVDRNIYEIYRAFKRSLEKVFDLIKIIKFWKDENYKINPEALDKYCNSAFFGKQTIIKNLAYEDIPFLKRNVYAGFLAAEETKMENYVAYFPERAERYVDLAYLANLYKDKNSVDRLIKKAILNMIAYGFHKDTYHFDVLECIESCHRAGSAKGDFWLGRMAPLIAEVNNYTDGDETSYLFEDLAEAYALINPQSLKSYYLHNANKENLFLAEDIFPHVIETSCSGNSLDLALLKTAIDKESILKLKKLSGEHNRGAKKLLKEQEEYFKCLENFPREKKNEGRVTHTEPESTFFDYETVTPDLFFDHINSLSDTYKRTEFVRSWCSIWFTKIQDKEQAYKVVLQWVESVGIENVEYQILDLLYPLALEFEGKEKSFWILCHSHMRGYGWSGRPFSRRENILQRWQYMKDHFPEKVKDFLKNTLTKVDVQGIKRFDKFLSIPRGVEFMIYFGFLKEAESMTETAVKFAEDLMANLKLPKPIWLNIEPPDSLDLLLSRLLWPSPIVRERAATALGELLSNSSVSGNVLKRLLEWVCTQNLESITAIGLLPIVKSARSHGKKLHIHISYDSVKNSIPKPSILSEVLLKEVFLALKKEVSTEESFEEVKEPLNLTFCPREHSPSKFFGLSIKGFLPPIYFDRAQEISKRYGFDFIKQWSWDAENIVKELGLEESLGEAVEFMGGRYSPRMPGFSSKLSEVYRSAFLRTLFLCYKSGKISKELLLEWTFPLCPIDINFWEINYQIPPEWWPALSQVSDSKIDTSKSKIWDIIEKLILDSGKKKDRMILAIDGPAKPFGGWFAEDLDTTITLVAFAYKILGKNLPNPEEIKDKILYAPVFSLYPSTERPLCFFEPQNQYFSTQKSSHITLDDIEIYPLVSRIYTYPINFWQVFRQYHAPFGLSDNLISLGLDMGYKSDGWFFSSQKKEISKAYSWNIGIIERSEHDFDIPSGQIIEIDYKWLQEFLQEQKVRLGYVVKVKSVFKKYAYDKPKIYEETKLFEVYPIIVL